MADLNTRAHALAIEFASANIRMLDVVGAVDGVRIVELGGYCGIGVGYLRSDGADIQWKAPGDSSYGPKVGCTSDGEYLLESSDPNKWCHIEVVAAYLHAAGEIRESKVLTRDVYTNLIAYIDVTAIFAAAGGNNVYQATVRNNSNVTLTGIVFWIDAAVSDLTISEDGVAYSAPTTEATGVSFPNLAPAGTDLLFIKRTISAGASSDPKVLNHIHGSFRGRF